MPRSPSSPSPPASRQPSGRGEPSRKGATTRRHQGASGSLHVPPQRPNLAGWSTSYQGGSSGSESDGSSDDGSSDETDTGLAQRGRPVGQHALGNGARNVQDLAVPASKAAHHIHALQRSGSSRPSSPAQLHERRTFTRSRSPAVHGQNGLFSNGQVPPARPMSPSFFSRQKPSPTEIRHLMPSFLHVKLRLPFARPWRVTVDLRQALENLTLLCSLGYVAVKMRGCARDRLSPGMWDLRDKLSPEMWISIELTLLILASVVYFAVTRISWVKVPVSADAVPMQPAQPERPASPRLVEGRENRRMSTLLPGNAHRNNYFGFVWMTVPKNYRDSADDGMLTGLLAGPFMSSALLYISQKAAARTPPSDPLPRTWIVERPKILSNAAHPLTALDALVLSRRTLVDLATVCSTILIVHVIASWMTERRHRRKVRVPEGEVSSVPRREGRRTYLSVLFTVSVSLWVLCVRIALSEMRLGIWQNITDYEIAVAAMFFQFSLYISIRMAHRGFTLGELAVVCFGATVLFMEALNLTIARIWPVTTPFIKTFRLPTPLLIYQIALIPGSLLVGFLLSPLLYLSRHIAQQPVRRLRFPEQKQKHRRLLALGFYVGAVLIVGGLVGLWTRWCLWNRNPWLWALFWVLEGRTPWSRPALLAYWAALGSISVAGWNRQLARSRRYRHRSVATLGGGGETGIGPNHHSTLEGAAARHSCGGPGLAESDPSAPATPAAVAAGETAGPLGLSFAGLPNLPALPNLPNGANVSNVATDWLDAANRHVPTLSLNARRKFFHALAVVMFLPGLVVDPAFTHLSFSAAFALFTFAEYVRYFALYPFGASVHVFMNTFLDQKDSGTAILSHFYLLIGCAGSVWFEGPSQLLQYTGTLVLGVGDALASIVGKRFGRHRWLATSPKTVEGSSAFVVSVVACAWLLRVCGLAESFSMARYTSVAVLSALLEAFSVQNDNVVLPLYMWSMLVFVDL